MIVMANEKTIIARDECLSHDYVLTLIDNYVQLDVRHFGYTTTECFINLLDLEDKYPAFRGLLQLVQPNESPSH